MNGVKFLIIIFISTFITNCCSVKNQSKRCQCKEYNSFISKYWITDNETGKNYIDTGNANFQISSMDDYKNITDCWIGKTSEQIRKMLPNQSTVKSDIIEIQTSKEVHDCRFKNIGCKPIYQNAMTIRVVFKSQEKIKRVEIRPSLSHGGGTMDIELYDYTIDDLKKN